MKWCVFWKNWASWVKTKQISKNLEMFAIKIGKSICLRNALIIFLSMFKWGLLCIPTGICIFQENSCWKITNSKVCYVGILTNGTFFVYMTYPNFEFSFKKSADFSCLFTFFQTRKKNWQLFTTFWEFHMFWQKSDVCSNFHTNNKIDQKIFWTKMFINLSVILLLNKFPLDISTEIL